jgi:hypothetical protein
MHIAPTEKSDIYGLIQDINNIPEDYDELEADI